MSSNVAPLRQVTRIRGQLEPTSEVKDAISRFLQEPIDSDKMPKYMYTSAQAIVDQEEFHSNQYYEEVQQAVETCRDLGSRALALILAAPLKIREFSNGTSQLLFSVQNRVGLAAISNKINKIPSLEKTAEQENMLYVELAKGALNPDKSKRILQIRLANGLFKEELKNPDKASKMLARHPSIVIKDMRRPDSRHDYLSTDDHSSRM